MPILFYYQISHSDISVEDCQLTLIQIEKFLSSLVHDHLSLIYYRFPVPFDLFYCLLQKYFRRPLSTNPEAA